MPDSGHACRPGTLDDAYLMAELVNMAGEGLPYYVWSELAAPGESPWVVGRNRARREAGSFSYRNATLLEEDGRVVACMIGYPLEDEPAPVNIDEMPPMFVPLQQLEDMVPGTWYVNVLATYPEYRGRGYGGRLLEIAEQKAAASGRHGLSVIVSDANSGARRLYEKHGYREFANRSMVKNNWINAGVNWILLTRSL